MKIKIQIDDVETRAVWNTILKAKNEVEKWPKWKKGKNVSMYESIHDMRVGNIYQLEDNEYIIVMPTIEYSKKCWTGLHLSYDSAKYAFDKSDHISNKWILDHHKTFLLLHIEHEQSEYRRTFQILCEDKAGWITVNHNMTLGFKKLNENR